MVATFLVNKKQVKKHYVLNSHQKWMADKLLTWKVEEVCKIHFHTVKNKKVKCKKAQPKEAVQAANTVTVSF